MQRLACGVSWLGNGLLYLLIGGALVGRVGWPVLATAGTSAAICHMIYLPLKRGCARPRPSAHRADLFALVGAPLDQHSFPSGHAMTLTPVLVPIVTALPAMRAEALMIWLLMAWARLACAHH